MGGTNVETALFEHRFWLQLLGDHARFILISLAPTETQDIDRAKQFVADFDRLLREANQVGGDGRLRELTKEAQVATQELRKFKLDILRRLLIARVSISLPPTFFNHALNELKEYQVILENLVEGKGVPTVNPVHYHLVWLSDAMAHAVFVAARLDPAEKDLRAKCQGFEETFANFYLKAVEMAGFLRTQLKQFPALHRFNQQVEFEMLLFKDFLEQTKKMRQNHKLLGALPPLLADHMAREECYYLTKLASVMNIPKPDCDPARPRVE